MAHWETVGESKESNVKVVSHERVKDTNPDTYVERGKAFFDQKKYGAAEKEYLEAARLSKMKTEYIDELMKFYYATRRKDFEKKADKIYKAYRKYEFDYVPTVLFGFLAYAGLVQFLPGSLGMILPFFISGGYYTLKPQNQFKYAARGENWKFTKKAICAAILYLIMVVADLFLVLTDTPVSAVLFVIEENPVVKMLEMAVGVVSLVICLVYFNRLITDIQRLVLKKKTGIFYKLSRIVRVGGMFLAVCLALSFMTETVDDWKRQSEWDALSQKLAASDRYMDSYLEQQDNSGYWSEPYDQSESNYQTETESWYDPEPEYQYDPVPEYQDGPQPKYRYAPTEQPVISMEQISDDEIADGERYIRDFFGDSVSNLYYYGNTTLDGQDAVLFESVDDYGGASDFLFVAFEDGTVGKYYADETWEIY